MYPLLTGLEGGGVWIGLFGGAKIIGSGASILSKRETASRAYAPSRVKSTAISRGDGMKETRARFMKVDGGKDSASKPPERKLCKGKIII